MLDLFARLPQFVRQAPKTPRRRSQVSSFRPELESLEDRTVPALTTAFSTSDTFLSMREAFVGEGRIGSAAKPQGNFTFELDIAKQTSGPFATGQTGDYAWSETQPEPFTLTYAPVSRTAVLTMNRTGQSVTYADVNWVDTLDDAIVVRVASSKPGADNGDPAKVTWDGPTKMYKVIIQVNDDGTWTWEDGSTGLKKQGTFDEVKK
jgi:hypothetical protein